MIKEIIGAVASVGQNVANSVKDKRQYSRVRAENRAALNAQRQNIENERVYNSPYMQTLRLKDAGFNPNSFMSQISPTASPDMSSAEALGQSQFTPSDFSGVTSAMNASSNQDNSFAIAQAYIQSAQKIAADNVELNYWRGQLHADTQKYLAISNQEHQKRMQESEQNYGKELQANEQAFQSKLQRLQQSFTAAQNEKDREMTRSQMSQEYQIHSEWYSEQQRMNDQKIKELNVKLSIAKQENFRQELITSLESELKSEQKKQQMIQTRMLEFEESMQAVNFAFDKFEQGASSFGKIRTSQEYSRHNREIERQSSNRDSNSDKARRYDMNQYYNELVKQGYSPEKAKELTQRKFNK